MGNKLPRNYQENCDIGFCIKHRCCLVLLHCKKGVDLSNSLEEQEPRTKQKLSRNNTNTMRSWHSQLPIPLPTVQIHYSLTVFGSMLQIYGPSAYQLCMTKTSQEPDHEVPLGNPFSSWDFLEEIQTPLLPFLILSPVPYLVKRERFPNTGVSRRC